MADTLPATDVFMGVGTDMSRSVSATYNATQKDKDKIDEIKFRRGLADENRQFFAEKAISNQYLYDNIVEEVGNFFSNMSVPWPFIIVQTYVGRAFLELCQDTPYFEVIEDIDPQRGSAKKVQKTINRELYMQDFPFKAILTYRNVFIRGTEFIGYLPWSEVNGVEMPSLFTPNWFRTWVNPNELSLEADDAYVIHDVFMRLDSFLEVYGNNRHWNRNAFKSLEPLQEDPANMYEDRHRTVLGIPNKKWDKYSKLIKLTFYWTKRELSVMGNDEINLRSGESPTYGKIPMREVWILPDDRSIYKPSLLDIGKDLFAEVNEKHNQRIDATNMILNPSWIAGGDFQLKKNKIPLMPGWIHQVGGMVDQLKPIPVDWRMLPASNAEQLVTESHIMRYSKTHEPTRGEPTRGRQTATASAIQEKRGAETSDVYNFLLNLMTVEKVASDFRDFHEMFMTHLSPFNPPMAEERPYADPEDFSGFYSFRAVGSMLGARDMERRDFLGLMSIIFSNPALAQGALPRVPEWISRAMDYFKIRSPADLYENIENFEPMDIQTMLEAGPGFGSPKGGGPGMLASGMPKPKGSTGFEGM